MSQPGPHAQPARPWPVLSRRRRLAAAAVGGLGAVWLRTLRIELLQLEHYLDLKAAGQAVILALWHAQMLMVMPLAARFGITTLVSPTADGELGERLARRLGIATVRGDSHYRPGQALITLAHALRGGNDIALFPDGPVGPAQQVKPGVLTLARLTGCPILPVGAAAATRVAARGSWDELQIPLPGTRVVAAADEPMFLPRAPADQTQDCRRLAQALDAQTRRAAAWHRAR